MTRRIFARFQPQGWVNDCAVDLDGAYEFDVTEQVLALGRGRALALEDDSYESDELWHEHPVAAERQHTGPFSVRVEDAIRGYYGVGEALR